MSTKISIYKEVVQNGGMLIDEWREIMGWGPIEGGDKPIRRLDIAQVNDNAQKGDDVNADNSNQGNNSK